MLIAKALGVLATEYVIVNNKPENGVMNRVLLNPVRNRVAPQLTVTHHTFKFRSGTTVP